MGEGGRMVTAGSRRGPMAENTAATRAADAEHIEDEVVRLLAQVLYLEPEAIDRESSFTEIGLDSILVVEYAGMLEVQLGVRLPANEVYDLRTPRNLAQRLAAGSAG